MCNAVVGRFNPTRDSDAVSLRYSGLFQLVFQQDIAVVAQLRGLCVDVCQVKRGGHHTGRIITVGEAKGMT